MTPPPLKVKKVKKNTIISHLKESYIKYLLFLPVVLLVQETVVEAGTKEINLL